MSLHARLIALVVAVGAALAGGSLVVFGAPADATLVRAVALGFAVLVVLLTLVLGVAYSFRYAARPDDLIPPVIVWGMAGAFLAVFGHTMQEAIARWELPELRGPTISLLLADFFSLLWLVWILIRQVDRMARTDE